MLDSAGNDRLQRIRSLPFDTSVHDVLAGLSADPVAFEEATGSYLVLGYDLVEELSRDRRLGTIGLSMFDVMGIGPGPLRSWYGGIMFTTDGEPHRRLRTLVQASFTRRSVEDLRPLAAKLSNDAIGRLGDGGEICKELKGLPTRIICRLLGIPDQDVPELLGWCDDLSPVFGMMTSSQIESAEAAVVPLLAYVRDLATERSGQPQDDLISRLNTVVMDGDGLSVDEVCSMVVNLLIGGHDTTLSQAGCSIYALLTNEADLPASVESDVALASLVSESIRLEPALCYVKRTAREALTIGSTSVPSGSIVLLCTAAANRDAKSWLEPNRLVPDRFNHDKAPRLLTFGAGPHYCLGAALAHVTLQEIIRSVCQANLRADTTADVVQWRRILGRSPAELHVKRCAAT